MQLAMRSTQVWVAHEAVDFRRAIDGLLAIVSEQFNEEIPDDSVFVFYNRAKNKLKVLGWHRNGYVLLYKRLERGRFHVTLEADGYISINADQLSWLLAGLDWISLSNWEDELTFASFH